MGSLLEIIGNHKLIFTSGKTVVSQLESILSTKIKNGTYHASEVQNKHDQIDKIEYFTAYDALEQNFDTWKEVRILTNFKYCSEINIHRQTLSYSNGCRYKYWKGLLFDEGYNEKLKNQYEFCKISWNEVHKFSSDFSRLIRGDTLIFFEDSRFQDEIDMSFAGESLASIIDVMKEKWKAVKLQDAPNHKDEFVVKNGWYFEFIT